MSFKNRSRAIAREHFWDENDRESYQCPDCGRFEKELPKGFEVHHKNGEPLDNRPENHVALCRACHNIREGKKPSMEHIKSLRDSVNKHQNPDSWHTDSPKEVLEDFAAHCEDLSKHHRERFERNNPDIDEEGEWRLGDGEKQWREQNMGIGEYLGFQYGWHKAAYCLADSLRVDFAERLDGFEMPDNATEAGDSSSGGAE